MASLIPSGLLWSLSLISPLARDSRFSAISRQPTPIRPLLSLSPEVAKPNLTVRPMRSANGASKSEPEKSAKPEIRVRVSP